MFSTQRGGIYLLVPPIFNAVRIQETADNHTHQGQQPEETDSSTNVKNDDAAKRYPSPRSTVLLFLTQQGGVRVHLIVVSFIIHVFNTTRRYQPPCCVVIPVFVRMRRYPPPCPSYFQHSEKVHTSSLCRYSCFTNVLFISDTTRGYPLPSLYK